MKCTSKQPLLGFLFSLNDVRINIVPAFAGAVRVIPAVYGLNGRCREDEREPGHSRPGRNPALPGGFPVSAAGEDSAHGPRPLPASGAPQQEGLHRSSAREMVSGGTITLTSIQLT